MPVKERRQRLGYSLERGYVAYGHCDGVAEGSCLDRVVLWRDSGVVVMCA